MRKIFLVTGFNNWGKTTLLKDLFDTKIFRKDVPYYYADCPFLVMPQSNDDLGKRGYEKEYRDRLQKFKKSNGKPKYIASAFCPTRERTNHSIEIIRSLYGSDQVEILLLEYKWCGHAKLLVSEIETFYAGERNVTVHKISAIDRADKLSEATTIFSGNLP